MKLPFIPIVLALLLALSVTGNGVLGWQWLAARDRATLAEERQSTAADAAAQCSAHVGDLQTAAEAQQAAGAAGVNLALRQSLALQRSAQEILASAPSVPGDDCKSAQDRATRWAQGRAKP